MHYVNRKQADGRPIACFRNPDGSRRYVRQETVDEVASWKEARSLVAEYQMSDPDGAYWLSRKPCKGWICQ